jgi:hypothetical protein
VGNRRTVFSVSDGEYSDYRVHWLFEDRDDANVTATRVGGYVEEFDLYGPGSDDEITIHRQWGATAYVNPVGQIEDTVHCYSIESFSDEDPEAPTIREFIDQRWCDPDGVIHRGTQYEIRAWADSEGAARKAARERAAKVAAELAEGLRPNMT